jgi:hypothetical protein
VSRFWRILVAWTAVPRTIPVLAGAVGALTAVALVGAVIAVSPASPAPARRSSESTGVAPDPVRSVQPVFPTPAPSTSTSTTTTIPVPSADLALPGCPPPPFTGPKPGPPWHPATLVPDGSLPATPAAAARAASTAAADGKGMWIWEYDQTNGGRTAAIVDAARAAGLHQLWVRVADSENGFYNSSVLAALVPAAHAAGLAVIGWGFPYLYDPARDARWTESALTWRSAGGQRLDGFSADIETASEGVDLTARRVALYLGLVRQADPGALVIGTVFPPTDQEWATYPYSAIAPYVDVLAPMVYWGCTEPVVEADQAITRLGPLAPLHLIGQAYDMAPVGGRVGPPTPAEISAFLEAAQRGGALGGSFWSWQSIDRADWLTVGAYSW